MNRDNGDLTTLTDLNIITKENKVLELQDIEDDKL